MTAPAASLTLTVRTPDDLLATVPVVLGFTPQDSLVMLALGPPRAFHARTDLPRGPAAATREAIGAVVDQMLFAVRKHRVPGVLFVVYTDDAPLATRVVTRLRAAFRRARVEVVAALRADGRRWWLDGPGQRPGFAGPGVPYDAEAHPITARAVLAGKQVLRSRAELEATVAHVPALSAGVVAALAALPDPHERARGAPADVADEVRTVLTGALEAYAAGAAVPDDAVVAWLLRALLDPLARDAAAGQVSRATADLHAGFWTEVVRRCPDPLVAAPAGLLAFAAWRAGDGARAWCAVDRCLDAAPDDTLGRLVATALAEAVPPHAWPEGPG
jgi:hypothetical protein